MKALLALAVVAMSFGIAAPSASAQKCPPIACDTIHQCFDTGDVRFCL